MTREPRAANDPETEDPGRKERVLHARVPESLDDALRAAAADLGISVSNLVRNVLANALEVVEAATQEVPRRAAAAAASVRSAAGARSDAGFASGPRSRPFSWPFASNGAPGHAPAAPDPVVLGWQEAALNLNAVCDRCNAILARGARAAIGIADRPTAQRFFRCLACLEELTRTDGEATDRPDRSSP